MKRGNLSAGALMPACQSLLASRWPSHFRLPRYSGFATEAQGLSSSLSKILKHALLHDRNPPGGLPRLFQQYDERADCILDVQLQAGARARESRDRGNSGTVLVAHVVHDAVTGLREAVCSGFAIGPGPAGEGPLQSMIVTCAHTLHEIRASPALRPTLNRDDPPSGSWIITDAPDKGVSVRPVHSILTAVLRSDLVLLAVEDTTPDCLPVSPHPALVGSSVYAHFVTTTLPQGDDHEWQPWVGGTWRKWQKCTVTGYRDHRGRIAETGTHEYLSQMMIYPAPPPGSSGGPIVDSHGAVIGVILGKVFEYGKKEEQGWGVPAHVIYEMFRLY